MKASVNPRGSNLPRRLVNATPTALSLHATRFIPLKFHSTLCSIKKKLHEKDLTQSSKQFSSSQHYVDPISSFILFDLQYVTYWMFRYFLYNNCLCVTFFEYLNLCKHGYMVSEMPAVLITSEATFIVATASNYLLCWWLKSERAMFLLSNRQFFCLIVPQISVCCGCINAVLALPIKITAAFFLEYLEKFEALEN